MGRGDPSALTAPRLSPSQEASLLVLRQNQQWICLDTLTPGTLYEFQVRVRAYLGSHKAWSPWSQPLAFRTKPAGTRGQTGWDGAQTGGGWLMCDLGAAGRGGLGVGYRAWPQSCLPAIVSPLIATLQGEQPGRGGLISAASLRFCICKMGTVLPGRAAGMRNAMSLGPAHSRCAGPAGTCEGLGAEVSLSLSTRVAAGECWRDLGEPGGGELL